MGEELIPQEEIKAVPYWWHLANILKWEYENNGVDVSAPEKLKKIVEWWAAPGPDSGVMQYLKIKAKHKGEQKATFKESGKLVADKFKEL